MSKNLQQVYTTNPITSNVSTDLMYFARSPYAATDDCGMTYANFAAQFGAPYTPAALTKTDDTNVTLTLGGTPATALLQAASITAGWTGQLSGTRGGTGVNNGSNTATFAGNLNFANSFTTSGNFAVTQTYTGVTNVTFPTSGTLATTAGTVASITGTANQVLANGTSGSAQTGAVTLTLPQDIATTSNVTFGTTKFSSITNAAQTPMLYDSYGNVLMSAMSAGPSAVNYLSIINNGAGQPIVLGALGSDSDIGLALGPKGTGAVGLNTAAPTNPLIIYNGTGSQHQTNFIFANTANARNVTFQDASGTVAFTSDINPWVDQTTASVTMSTNTGYTSNAGASLVTLTLPTTSAVGDWVEINGKGSGLWRIAQASGQQIFISPSNTTSGAGGSLSSVNQYDSVRLRCITANTIWVVVSQQSTGLTIV